MSVPKCFIFQDLEQLTEVFGGMSAGISGRKLPLWADFSFLIFPLCHSYFAAGDVKGRSVSKMISDTPSARLSARLRLLQSLHVRSVTFVL